MIGKVTSAPEEWCAELLPAARLVLRKHRGAEGDDLAQEAIVVTLEAARAGRLATKDDVRAFCFGVCRNLARADARTRERRDELLARNASMFDDVTKAAPAIDRERLWACINQLTARSRDVVVRTFVAEEEAETIARALDLSLENIRVIRFRALVALRTCMTGRAA